MRRRLPPVKALPGTEEPGADGLDDLDDADEAEVVVAGAVPLAVEAHLPAPGRRKPRGDAEDNGPKGE